MKKSDFIIISAVILFTFLFMGCGQESNGLDPKNPITLAMWHNFGGQMQQTMDKLIDEFNSTVGKKQGIIINVTAISSSSDLQDKLNMIVNGDPGAPQMPDITTCYPKTAVLFKEKNMIADLNNYFTRDELAKYVPQFLKEGRFKDGGLYVFPFAKSTEILYLNQTLFDRFSKDTGVKISELSSFEGIERAALKYYEWTDAKTPAIPNDGKEFFTADSWFNLAQAGMKQQGLDLFDKEALSMDNAAYERIWNCIYAPSVKGGFAIYNGYSSNLSKTGDILCSTGSSAGILFYGDTITYPNNVEEKVKYSILPYPVFNGSKKIAIQRGNGLCVAKSDKTREYAASQFLKWFTAEEQNLRFIFSTGYLPVTKAAFGEGMREHIKMVENPSIKEMLKVVTDMYENYEFFVAPNFNEFDNISKQYENDFKKMMKSERKAYFSADKKEIEKMSAKSLSTFKNRK